MPEYLRRFWIMLDGSVAQVPEGLSHLAFALQRPGAFGLSQDDMQFFNEAPGDSNRQEAMLDRVLAIGCGGIAGSDKQHSSKDMPAIMLEISERNLISRNTQVLNPASTNRSGMLTCIFHRESYPMNDRMVKFLRERKDGTEGITGGMNVLMKEWGSQRKWAQSVDSFLRGYQFASDPSKGVKCVRCGQGIGHEELIARNVCPRCGLGLA